MTLWRSSLSMSQLLRSNRTAVAAGFVTILALTAFALRLHSLATQGAAPGPLPGFVANQPLDSPASSVSPWGRPSQTSGDWQPGQPTPGAASPSPSPCGTGNFVFTLTTDKSTYHRGETVWATMTAKYVGTQCAFGGECIPFVTVRDDVGNEIATTMSPPNCAHMAPLTLLKGTLLQERYPWNQQPLNQSRTATTGEEVSRGTYTLTADWHSIGRSPSVTIKLVS